MRPGAAWLPRWGRSLSAAFLVALSLVALLGGLWSPGRASEPLQYALARGEARDLVLWWIEATRTVLGIVTAATMVAVVCGALLGGLSIYMGAAGGGMLARLVELTGSVPALVLVGVSRLWDPSAGVLSLFGTLAVLRSLEVAQLVRAQVLAILPSDYMEASRALGATRRWQLRTHVLPRLSRPLAVNLLAGASALVGLEAALSFTGLGLPMEVASWGGGLAVLAEKGSSVGLVCALASIGLTSAALHGLAARLSAAPSSRAIQPWRSRPRTLNEVHEASAGD